MSKELIIRTRPCSIELAKQKQKKHQDKVEISIFDDTTPTKEKSILKPVTTFCALFWVIFIYMNAFILPSVLTYLLMTTRTPVRSTDENQQPFPVNHTTKYCAGVAPWTRWQTYYTYGLTMIVDTSNCNFSSTPTYYTSAAGFDLHNGVTSFRALYAVSSTSFTIYPQKSVSWTVQEMLNYSHIYKWNVSWVGLYID